MKKIIVILLLPFGVFCQPWSSNGVCDLVDGQQWNNGGSTGCACTWYSLDGFLNCAFGDCGQSDLLECLYDCNGLNGNPTDQMSRVCDASSVPICWFQGGGSAGKLFCESVLPAEFLYMRGFSYGVENVIEWGVSSEHDVSHYEVRGSDDGQVFYYVSTVVSMGETSLESNYRVIDATPSSGITYYSVDRYDINGEVHNLGVVSIDRSLEEVDRIINMLGQDVTIDADGIKLIIYKSGAIVRVLNH